MERIEKPRYNFGGYKFGSNGLVVLVIQVNNFTSNGTAGYSTEISLELTPAEKIALITNLVELGGTKNDD